MNREDIRRRAEMERSDTLALRIFVVTCVIATAVWIKVLVQAFSMIGGK